MTINTYYNEEKLNKSHEELNKLIGNINLNTYVTIREDFQSKGQYGERFIDEDIEVAPNAMYEVMEVDKIDLSLRLRSVGWVPFVMVDVEKLLKVHQDDSTSQDDTTKANQLLSENIPCEEDFFVQANRLNEEVKQEMAKAIEQLNVALAKANAMNKPVYFATHFASHEIKNLECDFKGDCIRIKGKE